MRRWPVQRSLGRLRELSTGTLNVHSIFQPPYYDFDVVCVLPDLIVNS